MKPLVLIGETLPEAAMAELEAVFEVQAWDGTLDEVGMVSGMMGVRPSPALFDAAPNLRAIATISAGYDAYDVEDLTRRGIQLMNCPDALTETTADLAFALLMAAARRVTELAEWVKAGEWHGHLPEEKFGVDVFGKTLGVVGMGRIGAAIARRGALGFGMRILYTGPSAKPDAERELGAVRHPLEELLGYSDFVCLAMPLRPETEGLIGARELALMKPTGILVNIARGRVVDEQALIEALQAGRLRGAGLDVFQREPLPLESPLLKMPNVVALPHIGSATQQTRDTMALMSARNLTAYLIDGRATNVVNHL
jgi:lactate dehydrogenase-like 2-hydroxyacid dehydrogenase